MQLQRRYTLFEKPGNVTIDSCDSDYRRQVKTMFESLSTLVALGLGAAVFLLLLRTVGDMAEARGHSPWPW